MEVDGIAERAPSEGDGTGAAEVAARDERWLTEVYRPTERQVTARALVTGAVLGACLSAADLYIGLRIGWTFGMGITASVMGYALHRGLGRLRPSAPTFGTLENNTAQTVASAAAYMTSAGLVGSIPALAILAREQVIAAVPLGGVRLSLWLIATAALGVFVAVPLKRAMINVEQLRFPHGVVAAEMLGALHRGADAPRRSSAMFTAALVAGAWKLVGESLLGVRALVSLPGRWFGLPLAGLGIGLDTSALFYASGAIVGLRVGLSAAAGALFAYLMVTPWLVAHGWVIVAPAGAAADPTVLAALVRKAATVHAIVAPDPTTPGAIGAVVRAKWTVWPGTALMLGGALGAFFARGRTLLAAFRGLFRARAASRAIDARLAAVEVPPNGYALGLALATVACVWMQRAWFGVPLLLGLLSVALAFVLSVVAARATGETGITPASAVGKITQLTFGLVMPGDAVANLMTATVTAGSAAHAADLLNEVKTGYLLGGSPRKQLWAQLLGVVVGGVACVPLYLTIVRPEQLGTTLPAPQAVAWASVAKVLRTGVDALPHGAKSAAIGACAVGLVLGVIEASAPARLRRWLPSAAALGIGMMIDANDALTLMCGAVLAALWRAARPGSANAYKVVGASGVVAGEGVAGVLAIVWRAWSHRG